MNEIERGNLLYFSLCLQITLLYSLECNTIQLEKNQLYFQNYENSLLLQHNSADYSTIQQKSQIVIDLNLRIPQVQNEEIISTQLIDSQNPVTSFHKFFCKLIRGHHTYIGYTDEIELNLRYENKPLTEPLISIIKVQDEDNCESFLYLGDNQFLIFCVSKTNINIYQQDMINNTNLISQYQIDYNQKQEFKREYIYYYDNTNFILLYQCSSWAILNHTLNYTYSILDQDIAKEKFNLNISYVDNIQICQNYIYLIQKEKYLRFQISMQKQLNFNFEVSTEYVLLKLLIGTDCQISYFITCSHQNIEKNYVFDNQFLIFKNCMQTHIYFTSKMIFLVTEKELQVIVNPQYIENYEINFSQLQFLSNSNIFYQLDLISHQFIFYKYQTLKHYLQPIEQYIFEFNLNNLQQNIPIQCFQIVHLQEQELKTNINQQDFINECQESLIIYYPMQSNLMKFGFDFKVFYDSQIEVLNITDVEDFESFCSLKYNPKESILLYYYNDALSQENITILKLYDFIVISDCLNSYNFYINFRSYQLFYYRTSFLLVKDNEIIIKTYHSQKKQIQQKKISIETRIVQVFQQEQYVFLIPEDETKLIIIDLQIQNNWQLPYPLKKFFQNSLLKIKENNQFKPQYFYKKVIQRQILQYCQYLISFSNQDAILNIHYINNYQIVSIFSLIKNVLQILAVHQSEDIISQFALDDQNLLLQQNYTFQDATIFRPLISKYLEIKSNNNKGFSDHLLTIVVNKEQQNYLYVFTTSQSKSLKLKRVIQIGQTEFFYSNNSLLYHDEYFQIKTYHLTKLSVQMKIQNKRQEQISNTKRVSFTLISRETNPNLIQCTLKLNFINQCFKLFQFQKSYSLILNQNKQMLLKINDLVSGPISNLEIKENPNIRLSGPLLKRNLIPFCKSEQDNYCMIKYQNILFKTFMFKGQLENKLIAFQKNISNFKTDLIGLFLINSQSLLSFEINEMKIVGKMFSINNNYSDFSNNIEFKIQQPIENIEIYQTGDIIHIQNQFSQAFLSTKLPIIKQIKSNYLISSLIYIENSDQWYIDLSNLRSSTKGDFNITLFQYQDENFRIIQQFNINYDQFELQIEKYIQSISQDVNKWNEARLLQSNSNDKLVDMDIFYVFSNFSFIIKYEIDLQKSDLNIGVQKVLRNPQNFTIQQIQYLKHNLLLLYNQYGLICIFDLRMNLSFYDCIYLKSNNSSVIYSYNTTHILFFEHPEILRFIDIDYEINLEKDHKVREAANIIIQNELSSIEVNLIISTQKETLIQRYFTKNIGLCLCILLILLILKILYNIRQKRNQRKKESKVQIELNSQVLKNENSKIY